MTGPYEDLANAIVLQASKDYRKALKTLRVYPKSRSAKADRDELERFFRFPWYACLTSVDGETLIRKIREEVES